MATVKGELEIPVFCECGMVLSQIGPVGLAITVKRCPLCYEQDKQAAYEKGLKEGREEREQNG